MLTSECFRRDMPGAERWQPAIEFCVTGIVETMREERVPSGVVYAKCTLEAQLSHCLWGQPEVCEIVGCDNL